MAKAVQFQIGGTLRWLEEDEPSPAGAYITLRYEAFTIKAKGANMAYNLPADRKVQVKVSYIDKNGNPAMVDGPVEWSSSDENVATVESDADGDSSLAVITPGINIGNVQITATADADIGEGVRELLTIMDVTVIGGEAVAGTIAPTGEAQPFPQPKR